MTIDRISPSKLQLYADCPRCFLLSVTHKGHFVTTPAIQFGARLHKALELYHKAGIFQTDFELTPYFDEYIEIYTPEYDMAEEFWKVRIPRTDIALSLKIDLIKDNFLIEHKTSARPYSQEYVDKHNQITAYSWAWQQMYSEREDGIKVNVFNTNPKPGAPLLEVFETERTNDHFDEWLAWVYAILEGIEQDEFEPRPAPWHNYEECPYYKERE